MSVVTRVLSALLALIGAVLAYAVVAGRLPPELARRSLLEDTRGHEPGQAHGHGHAHADGEAAGACCETDDGRPGVTTTTATAAAATAATALTPNAARPAARAFTICEREEARVSTTELRLSADGPPLIAVGCGSSVQVLGFERFEAVIEPRRLLELHLSPRSPAEAPHAIETFAADLDGDDRRDLVTTVLLVDAAGSPRGGGLFVSTQRAEGSFDPARRVLELAAFDVAVAALDTAKGQDLLLLNGGDARLGRPSALWLVTAGPSPLRAAIREASVGSRAVAACDLDGDGLDELLEGGGEDGLLRLWPSGLTTSATPRTLAAVGVRELLCIRDGERGHAVAIAGEQLSVLRARPDAEPEVAPIAGGAGLRSLHALDVDGDGSEELIGYAHPELVAFSRQGEGLQRRVVATLAGEASVLDARLLQLGGAPEPELFALTVADGAIAASALVDVAPGSTVMLPEATVPAPASPLLQRVALR